MYPSGTKMKKKN